MQQLQQVLSESKNEAGAAYDRLLQSELSKKSGHMEETSEQNKFDNAALGNQGAKFKNQRKARKRNYQEFESSFQIESESSSIIQPLESSEEKKGDSYQFVSEQNASVNRNDNSATQRPPSNEELAREALDKLLQCSDKEMGFSIILELLN